MAIQLRQSVEMDDREWASASDTVLLWERTRWELRCQNLLNTERHLWAANISKRRTDTIRMSSRRWLEIVVERQQADPENDCSGPTQMVNLEFNLFKLGWSS